MRGRGLCLVLALLLVCLGSGQGHAQVVGQVDANWQGGLRSWQVVTIERQSGPVHSGEFDPVRLGYEIAIQAVADAAQPNQDSISFELLLVQQEGQGSFLRAGDMLFLPQGMSGPFWSSRGNPFTLEVLYFDVWGDVGNLEAVFDGTLCHRARLSAPVDRDNCRAINGFISTKLYRR
ncbi:hypothetical protein [Aliiroseovarius sp.]|uniref:hypothetical protein n=1 Tax=Aliiroseovarius sp. TaxID=1872442 RepID=UPI003BAA92B0